MTGPLRRDGLEGVKTGVMPRVPELHASHGFGGAGYGIPVF